MNFQVNLASFLDDHVGQAGARNFLRKVQMKLNWVPREALEIAASHYGVSFASLYEEVTLSPYFSLEPRGDKVIEVCQGLSCREAGSKELLQAMEVMTGLKAGQTAADGSLTLLGVSCFGRCAIGANGRCDGQFFHNLGVEDARTLLNGRKSPLLDPESGGVDGP